MSCEPDSYCACIDITILSYDTTAADDNVFYHTEVIDIFLYRHQCLRLA